MMENLLIALEIMGKGMGGIFCIHPDHYGLCYHYG